MPSWGSSTRLVACLLVTLHSAESVATYQQSAASDFFGAGKVWAHLVSWFSSVEQAEKPMSLSQVNDMRLAKLSLADRLALMTQEQRLKPVDMSVAWGELANEDSQRVVDLKHEAAHLVQQSDIMNAQAGHVLRKKSHADKDVEKFWSSREEEDAGLEKSLSDQEEAESSSR
eukprot:TRINITY_DN18066_c0_g1_i3.p1 TRINITY_DN18066_c0_g1~~TRINITY_DN18066_c0_g1_i3.p1  ORF type:complete len:172 (+),score=42.02 TRINITY_DN18066_c0_g1_i3:88-603(+)